MKYCTNCRRMAPGAPLFCVTCGRTFDVRLCPRHHPNSRSAEFCVQCGSSDLSEPHQRASWSIRFLIALTRRAPMLFLSLTAAVLISAFLRELGTDAVLQKNLVSLALLGGLARFVYTRLPEVVRRHVRSVVRKGKP